MLSSQSVITEPVNYLQTSQNPLWLEAMQKDLSALQLNQTLDLVPLPAKKKAIGCRWVYKVKFHANGSLERYKARLVAKGYNQKYGIDFEETFLQ